MVLNALAIDPKRVWKGPWRWFAEDLLDCCSPLEVVKKEGVTFTQFACLAKCNGATVSPNYASSSYSPSSPPFAHYPQPHHRSLRTVEQFRREVVEITREDGAHLVISYHRGTLGQSGTGHFRCPPTLPPHATNLTNTLNIASPIAGYHPGRDLGMSLFYIFILKYHIQY